LLANYEIPAAGTVAPVDGAKGWSDIVVVIGIVVVGSSDDWEVDEEEDPVSPLLNSDMAGR